VTNVARVVQEWPETDRSRNNFSRYADGQIWECIPEEDFTCTPTQFRARALSWGKPKGFLVKTKIDRDLDKEDRPIKSVTIQFIKKASSTKT